MSRKNITCPKCRRVQYVVCDNKECVCWKRVPKGKKAQVNLPHDGVACPYCGFAEHIDFWFERDLKNMPAVRVETANQP